MLFIAAAVWATSSVPFGTKCDPCELTPSPLLNALSHWDGSWYVQIARDGYSYQPGVRSSVTFFPILPLLMRASAQVLGRVDNSTLTAAGIVIANAALLVALAYLVELGRLEGDVAAGRRAALYLLVFPTTIFLSAVYPTSLFLAFAIGAVVEVRRQRWALSAALAGLAALARPYGVALVVPLALEAIAKRDLPGNARRLAALGVPVAAFVGWQAYLYRTFGDPLLFIQAQLAYGRRPSLPLKEIGDLFDRNVYGFPWIVAAVVALITVLVVWSWRRTAPPTAGLATAVYLVALSSGTLTSFPRYALAIFPAFVVLGMVGTRRAIGITYVVIAGVIALVFAAMFGSWYWIG
ncbi:MAG: hypothetical protein KGJ98_08750 [Chloroflexota bacterium]|nr:hypothetical protein [Chloroflexota bacterium]